MLALNLDPVRAPEQLHRHEFQHPSGHLVNLIYLGSGKRIRKWVDSGIGEHTPEKIWGLQPKRGDLEHIEWCIISTCLEVVLYEKAILRWAQVGLER